MRILSGFCITLLAATGLWAQNRAGFVQPMPGRASFGGGSVLFPGGVGLPGVVRTTGSVLHPSGITPQVVVPGLSVRGVAGQNTRFRNGSGVIAYPVPVYVGGYGYGYGYGGYDAMAPAPAQATPAPQQPNVIVIYPSGPGYSYAPPTAMGPQPNMVEAPQPDLPAPDADQPAATNYLLAFKDHSIYSAVAYWVDGDTLHYFTSGNTHNQVSLSLVDRELTKRLNEGSGLEVKLPPAK